MHLQFVPLTSGFVSPGLEKCQPGLNVSTTHTHLIGIAESPGSLDLDNLEPGCTTQLCTQSPAFSSVSPVAETYSQCYWSKKASLAVCHPSVVGPVPHPLPTCSSQKLWAQGYFSEPFSPNHVSRTTKPGAFWPTGNNLSIKAHCTFNL